MGGFRLGVVLRLREMAEDAARARLGAALAHQREATNALVVLVERQDAAQDEVLALQGAGAAAGDILGAQRLVERAVEGVAQGRAALETTNVALLEARALLAEATKRREVVERLKDRARLAEVLEAQRHEDSVLSEIAGVKHARGMAAEHDR